MRGSGMPQLDVPDGERDPGPAEHPVGARGDRVLSRARVALEHGDVALVCHGHMSRALAVRWVDLPIAAGGLILMNPAAITVLGTYHEKPCIEHANVVPFKPPALKPSSTATGQHRTVPSGAVGDVELGHA